MFTAGMLMTFRRMRSQAGQEPSNVDLKPHFRLGSLETFLDQFGPADVAFSWPDGRAVRAVWPRCPRHDLDGPTRARSTSRLLRRAIRQAASAFGVIARRSRLRLLDRTLG